MQVETDNLPAMAGDQAAHVAGRARTSSPPGRTLSDSDGLTPYMDYATPTFYDDFSGAVQRAAGGQAQAGRVHEGRAGGLREVHRHAVTTLAPPGEPRRVAYLYLLPGLVDLRPVRAGAAAAQRVAVAVHVGRRDGRARGPGSTTTRRSSPTRELRAAFMHALVLVAFYAVAADRDRAAAGGGDVAHARARAGAVPDRAVPAAGDRARRRRRDVADDLRARGRADQRGPARDRARRAGAELARLVLARAAVGRADRHVGDVRAGDGAVHRRRAEDPAVAL